MQAIQEINEAFLIYHLSARRTASEAGLEPHQKAGTDAGCNLNPLQSVKQRKVFAGMASAPAISGIAKRVPNTRSQCATKAVQKQRNLPVFRDMKSNGGASSVLRNKNPFQEATVFVLGEGNCTEYQKLVDNRKGKQGKHVLYGCC
ncbi:hypothetical protein Celaphus_00000415 [Cervus elaphus hippelaphus]|uniref:Uncharacterized protein n=1 Tax=Cervus elaphus hippelaphus TaxID=46360 RepID=A0A212D826_CEREH|nr:hypothetical protein Celaphus_00000415 [Cervus elaphus hippelaphus]